MIYECLDCQYEGPKADFTCSGCQGDWYCPKCFSDRISPREPVNEDLQDALAAPYYTEAISDGEKARRREHRDGDGRTYKQRLALDRWARRFAEEN